MFVDDLPFRNFTACFQLRCLTKIWTQGPSKGRRDSQNTCLRYSRYSSAMQRPHLRTWPQSQPEVAHRKKTPVRRFAKMRNLAFVPVDPPRSSDLDARPQRCSKSSTLQMKKPLNQVKCQGPSALLKNFLEFDKSRLHRNTWIACACPNVPWILGILWFLTWVVAHWRAIWHTFRFVTPATPNAHAPCLTLIIVGFTSVQLLFLEHQIIARLPGLMPQQQKRKS